MAGRQVFCLGTLVVLASVLVPTLGWLDLNDTKNCFCKAVNNNNYGEVIRDFGSIQRCHQFGHCPCSHTNLMTCSSACEHKVKEWVCDNNCGGGRKGMMIRAHFKASVCSSGTGRDIYVCGKKNNCARG